MTSEALGRDNNMLFGRTRTFRRCLCVALLSLLAVAVPAAAQDKGGLSPSRLKLPTGPGSLEGVGENAELDLNMGVVSYAVPFALPSGYGGFGPKLGLRYSSTGGSSATGMGFSFGEAAIERMTARGLPRYDETDLFASESGSELVRLGSTSTYRARYEGGFVRYRWLGSGGAQGDGSAGYWVAEYPDGSVGYFGADSSGAVVPESRIEGQGGTYRYALVERVDALGHRIRYSYRQSGGQPLLVHIGWAYGATDPGPHYEVELLYEARPDELSDGKSGVEVRLLERLLDVRVLVQGQLLRRYHLTYESVAESGGLSRLQTVLRYGTGDSAPFPVAERFTYSQGLDPSCMASSDCARPYVVTVGSVGADFRTKQLDFVDLNGDALPDVLDTTGGVHRIYEQTLSVDGVPSFRPVRTSAVAGSGAIDLSSADVQLMDVDGDGFMDALDGLNAVVLYGSGTGDWRSSEAGGTDLPSFAMDADLRLMDVDYDRRIDVVHLDAGGGWYRRNLGGGQFEALATPIAGVGRSFSGDGLRLADLNGDGMLDVAEPVTGAVFYYLNLGYGRFSAAIEIFGLPDTLSPAEMELVDLNADGLSDVVVVQGTEVRYALNENGLGFGPMVTTTSAEVDGAIPERLGDVTVRFGDMNGTGSTDVVWVSPSGEVTYLELFPGPPNLLVQIENGLGKVTRAEYGTSVSHMARDGGPSAWRYRLPHAMRTLERLITRDTLTGIEQVQELHYRDGYYDGQEHQFRGFAEVEVFAVGDPSIEEGRSIHRFDVGATDRYRKGLALSQVTMSAGSVLSVVQHVYDDCDVAALGSPMALPVRWQCLKEQTTTVQEGRPSEEHVRIAESYTYDGYGNRVGTYKWGVVSIGSGGCAPCEERPEGVQGAPCGLQCTGDEQFEETYFVQPGAQTTGGRWILRAPYQKRAGGTLGSAEAVEERLYYDGPAYEGLPLGQLSAGILRRSEALADRSADRWVQTARLEHDDHGNVLAALDALGHRVTMHYDAAGLYPIAEERHFDDAARASPYLLRREVSYAPVLEQISASTEWMRIEGGSNVSERRETRYGYDEYGRLVAIALPGDSLALPTSRFQYDLGDPVSRIVTRSRTTSGGPMDLLAVQCFDGLGRKYQERQEIEPGRYQVSGFTRFNVQGKAYWAYQPYASSSAYCDPTPPAGTRFVEARFDASGRPLRAWAPDADLYGSRSESLTRYAPLTVVSYDAEDLDPNSPHYDTPESIESDGLGRLVRATRSLGAALPELLGGGSLLGPLEARAPPIETRVTYDALGRVRSLIDDAGNEQWQVTDLLGRVVEVHHPDSGITTLGYDDAGNLLRRTDARGITSRSAYDEANRPVRSWEEGNALGTEVSWQYDKPAEGCDLSADPTTGVSECSYGEGQLVQERFPLLDGQEGVERIGYDARGQPARRTHHRGSATFVVTERYDNAGRVIARSYPGGFELSARYDGAGRVIEVPGYLPEVRYDARGQLEALTYGNGATVRRSYDGLLRLSELVHELPGGDRPIDQDYRYSRIGNLLEVQDRRSLPDDAPSASARYRYDSLYRLRAAHLDPERPEAPEELLLYRYDRLDNLVEKTSSRYHASPAHLGTLTVGSADRSQGRAGPHAIAAVAGEPWQYDEAGNVTDQSDSGLHHQWDHLGRLVRSDSVQGGSVEVAYGGGSARVQKREGGHFVEYLEGDFEVRDGIGIVYVMLGAERIAEIELPSLAAELLPDAAPIDPSGGPGGDGQIDAADAWVQHARKEGLLEGAASTEAGWRSDPDVLLSAATRRLLAESGLLPARYYHSNHQGTVSAVSGSDGELLDETQAYPGGLPRAANDYPAPWGYTGQERDQLTGLSYHDARYLDLRTSSWLSADPAFALLDSKLESLTERTAPYAYASRNPVNRIDPSGLDDDFWARAEGLLKAAAGAAEITAGVALATATSPSGVGVVAGLAVVAHGADGFVTGIRQAVTGRRESTLTSQAIQATGVSRETADLADEGIRVLATAGASSAASAPAAVGRVAGAEAGAPGAAGGGARAALTGTLRARARQLAGFADEGTPVILDENIAGRGVAEALRGRGFNVRSVQEAFGRGGIADADITQLAETVGGRVLTQNVRDFPSAVRIGVDARVGTHVDTLARILSEGL